MRTATLSSIDGLFSNIALRILLVILSSIAFDFCYAEKANMDIERNENENSSEIRVIIRTKLL